MLKQFVNTHKVKQNGGRRSVQSMRKPGVLATSMRP